MRPYRSRPGGMPNESIQSCSHFPFATYFRPPPLVPEQEADRTSKLSARTARNNDREQARNLSRLSRK